MIYIFILIILLGCLSKTVFIFLLPGALFLLFLKKGDLLEAVVYVTGLSMSFWVIAFWFLKYLPLGLTDFFIIIVSISLFIISWLLFKKKVNLNISINKYEPLQLSILVFLIGLRFLPMLNVIVPSGQDMSMHAYITQLIVHSNGVPTNYYPLLGVESFNSFPVGFHTLSALISLLDHIPAYRSVFIMSCFTYGLLILFLFVFLKNFVSWPAALISTVFFNFLTTNPQDFSAWGGTPTILALSFLVLSLCFFEKMINKEGLWFTVCSPFLIAAILLCHVTIFVQSLYVFGMFSFLLLRFEKEDRQVVGRQYIFLFLFTVILLTPYLFNLDIQIKTPATIGWIKDWVRNTNQAWHGTVVDAFWSIPYYICNSYGFIAERAVLFFFICSLGFLFFLKRDYKAAIFYSLFLILSCILILNAQYWILPFSYMIYPERVAVMTIIPLSLFFADTLNTVFCFLEYKKLKAVFFKGIVLLIIVGTLSAAVFFNKIKYIRNIVRRSSLTSADMKAFDWLKQNVKEKEVIKNSYCDAGVWIPSILFMPVTEAHVNVIYLDKRKPLNTSTYVYIGKKSVCKASLNKKIFDKDYRYIKVYDQEDVHIYKIKNVS